MTSTALTRPRPVRIARSIATVQSVVALVSALGAALFALGDYHSWRHPRPNTFDGLVFGLAVGVLVPSVVVLLTIGVPALLLRRPNRPAAAVLAIGEGLVLLAMAFVDTTYTVLSADHLEPTLIWLAIVVPAVSVIVALLSTPVFRWLDSPEHG